MGTAAAATAPSVIRALVPTYSYEALREQRSREADERDKQAVHEAIAINHARHIEEVATPSGASINVWQVGNPANRARPITVDTVALQASFEFLLDNMQAINDANGQAISSELIAHVQDEARAGQLQMDVTLMLTTDTSFRSPGSKNRLNPISGHKTIRGGGVTANTHEHGYMIPRAETTRPVLYIAPDIYRPGPENVTPTPTLGQVDGTRVTFGQTAVTPEQSMMAYFGHEMGHALFNLIGDRVDPETQEARFVLPLNAYHTAAMLGQADGAVLRPAFTIGYAAN